MPLRLTPTSQSGAQKPLCRTDPLRHPTGILYRPPPQDCAWYDIFLRRLDVGLADRMVMRVTFVGELDGEILHPLDQQNHVHDTLMEGGLRVL